MVSWSFMTSQSVGSSCWGLLVMVMSTPDLFNKMRSIHFIIFCYICVESNKPIMGFRLLMRLYVCLCIVQIKQFWIWIEFEFELTMDNACSVIQSYKKSYHQNYLTRQIVRMRYACTACIWTSGTKRLARHLSESPKMVYYFTEEGIKTR